MTQNLYLGSSLGPALEAQTPEAFVEAVAQIYATVQYTNFPARAEAIAAEVEEKGPDLIGLQEVTNWTTVGENAPAGYDFLAILQSDLEARGLHYTAASISHNANIGPAPLAFPGCVEPGPVFTCYVTLEDRDVILVNDETPGLAWSNPQSGQYATQQTIASPVGPLSFDRGWASIDATLKHQPFRFVDTHLETEESPLVQQEQAAEFLAGPGNGGTVVATGDFNSASDGSTTTSYAQLTAPGQFRDSLGRVTARPRQLVLPGVERHTAARAGTAEQFDVDAENPDRPDPQPRRRPLQRARSRTDRRRAVRGRTPVLALRPRRRRSHAPPAPLTRRARRAPMAGL